MAVQRPAFISAVGVGAFILALVGFVLSPQQSRRIAPPAPPVGSRPDTGRVIEALRQARIRLAAAESSLAIARVTAATPVKPVPTVDPVSVARRDSLASAVNDLDGLLTRVETAPVGASYRALAESPHLAANTRVRALLDSLSEVERERESFGSTGGADPVYVALSTRSAEIGRTIEGLAQERRNTLRETLATLNTPTAHVVLPVAPGSDTAGWLAERDSAQSLVSQATSALTDAQAKTREFDRRVAASRAAPNAPPVAFLAAALVIGIALGFGSAFIGEMRSPRISDEHEAERVTGTRVLATVRPRPRDPARDRRLADRQAPPFFDPRLPAYQLTYLHVARTGASRLVLNIVAADTGIAAVVGMNVAAIAADEARSAIVIDTDARHLPVASALRCHAEPGIADVVTHHIDWSEVTTQTVVGRDRVIDVLPSGVSKSGLDERGVTSFFAQEGARLARHYEAIVIVSSIGQSASGLPGSLPISDVIVCARLGHTRLVDLQAALDDVRRGGGTPVGIVLWDAPPPTLPTPDRIQELARPVLTAEMRALTGSN